ncbi:MAG: hypothetical protein R3F22_08275 [Lysobacteraceae bacterium]
MENQSKVQEKQGSIAAGFAVGWTCMIAGGIVAGLIIATIGMLTQYESTSTLVNAMLLLAGLLPLIAPLAAAIYFWRWHEKRTALGVLYAIFAAIALILLLMAACFGLLAMGSFH